MRTSRQPEKKREKDDLGRHGTIMRRSASILANPRADLPA